MATIVRRGANQWQVKVRREGYPKLNRTFGARSEAEIWARRIEGEIDSGLHKDWAAIRKTTLASVLERYITDVLPAKRGGLKEISKLKPYLSHHLVQRPLAVIAPQDIAALRDWRLTRVSPGTVLREFCVLRHALEVARREWFLPVENPICKIRLPRANPPRDRRLQSGEEEMLIVAAEEYGGVMPVLVVWLLDTAMRRGEATALQRADVCLISNTARIVRSKNGYGRTVPLTMRAAAVVEMLPKRTDGLLFGVGADSVTQAFARICRRAGIQGLTVHDLRHEATSRLVDRGLSMPEVMAITGHRDPRMMLRYYHPHAEQLVRRIRTTDTAAQLA